MKAKVRLSIIGGLALTVLIPLVSFGHHSFFGRFDTETFVEMEAEILEVFWRNPHVYVIVKCSGETRMFT